MLAPWGTSYPGRCASETAPPGLLSPWCSRSDGPHRSVQTAGWSPHGTLGALSLDRSAIYRCPAGAWPVLLGRIIRAVDGGYNPFMRAKMTSMQIAHIEPSTYV